MANRGRGVATTSRGKAEVVKPLGFDLSGALLITVTEERSKRLQSYLEQENNILLQIAKSFRQLDKIAQRLGLLTRTQSFTSLVTWWPLICVVGTSSSAKTAFINDHLGIEVRAPGAASIDDKFTVICFSNDDNMLTLPGLALDADPRFPFYQVATGVANTSSDQTNWVESHLQLKTCRSAKLRGQVFVDLPGDTTHGQDAVVPKINEQLLALSDLVLVITEAGHTGPDGAKDLPERLQVEFAKRADAGKFLFVLDQSADAGVEIRQLINTRLEQIEVERAYRIIRALEQLTRCVEGDLIPSIRDAKERWKKRTGWLDGAAFGLLALLLIAGTISAGYWEGLRFSPPWMDNVLGSTSLVVLLIGVFGGTTIYLHYFLRRVAANSVLRTLKRDQTLGNTQQWVSQAFEKNTSVWRSFLRTNPAGWGGINRRRIEKILNDTDRYVQTLRQMTLAAGTATPLLSHTPIKVA